MILNNCLISRATPCTFRFNIRMIFSINGSCPLGNTEEWQGHGVICMNIVVAFELHAKFCVIMSSKIEMRTKNSSFRHCIAVDN